MKLKIFSSCKIEDIENDTNDFIKDKEIISMNVQCSSLHDNNMND